MGAEIVLYSFRCTLSDFAQFSLTFNKSFCKLFSDSYFFFVVLFATFRPQTNLAHECSASESLANGSQAKALFFASFMKYAFREARKVAIDKFANECFNIYNSMHIEHIEKKRTAKNCEQRNIHKEMQSTGDAFVIPCNLKRENSA